MTNHANELIAKPSLRQIVFNWLMESPLETVSGYWGGSEEVARVDELLAAIVPEIERLAKLAALTE